MNNHHAFALLPALLIVLVLVPPPPRFTVPQVIAQALLTLRSPVQKRKCNGSANPVQQSATSCTLLHFIAPGCSYCTRKKFVQRKTVDSFSSAGTNASCCVPSPKWYFPVRDGGGGKTVHCHSTTYNGRKWYVPFLQFLNTPPINRPQLHSMTTSQ